MSRKSAKAISISAEWAYAFDDSDQIWFSILDFALSAIHEQSHWRSLNDLKKSATLSEWDKRAGHSLQKDLRIVDFEGMNRFQLRRELERQSINSRSSVIYERISRMKIIKANLDDLVKYRDQVYESDVNGHQRHVSERTVKWDEHWDDNVRQIFNDHLRRQSESNKACQQSHFSETNETYRRKILLHTRSHQSESH